MNLRSNTMFPKLKLALTSKAALLLSRKGVKEDDLPTGQQATLPPSSKAQCCAPVQHQLGSPIVSHEIWLAGHIGALAGEKGTAVGVMGGEPPPPGDGAPAESPGPLLAITMLTAGW